MTVAVVAAAMLVIGAVAAGSWAHERPAPSAAQGAPSLRLSDSAAPAASASPAAADLAASFNRDLGSLSSRAGVVVVPLGGGAPVVLGAQAGGVAWSTIKVPLVVAAREHRGWPAIRSSARAAITVSDNDAARALWASLGSGRTAASRVEAVLATAGDGTTRVQSKVVRAGFTPFGQTRWTLRAQARVMAALACQPSAAETVELMRKVVPSQRWGLGRWKDAPIKGGWGPLESGTGYLVRQMGVVPLRGGKSAAVTLLVKAPKGFDAGVADVNRVAAWLARHSAALPAGRC